MASGVKTEFRRWRRIIPRAGLCLLLTVWLGMPGGARANGWEHGAIPFEALIKALGFEQAETRRRAAQSLGYRGQPEAVEHLVGQLEKPEPVPEVRSAIYVALGLLGQPRALPLLLACLQSETRDELRGDCIAALGNLGHEDALPSLLALLSAEQPLQLRSAAVDALGKFAHPESIGALGRIVTAGNNRSLHLRAIRSLGRTAAAAAARPLLDALTAAQGEVERLAIVDALARIAIPEIHDPLRRLLEASEDPLLRSHITLALAKVRDGAVFATLVDLLSDDVPAVRFFAVGGLRELGDSRAAEEIAGLSLSISAQLGRLSVQRMVDEGARTLGALSLQVAALAALGDLDAQIGLPALLAAVPSPAIPRSSATALRLAEGFYRRQRIALYGLGYSGSREAAELLAGDLGLGHWDFRLRAVAARSLGVLGFPDSLDALEAAVSDSSAEVRWTAAAVLGLLGEPRAVGSLLDRLSDPVAEVRRESALSLGYLGARQAVERLSRMAREDENGAAKEAAAYALDLITSIPD